MPMNNGRRTFENGRVIKPATASDLLRVHSMSAKPSLDPIQPAEKSFSTALVDIAMVAGSVVAVLLIIAYAVVG